MQSGGQRLDRQVTLVQVPLDVVADPQVQRVDGDPRAGASPAALSSSARARVVVASPTRRRAPGSSPTVASNNPAT